MLEYTLHELFHKSRSLEKERGAATESEDPAAAASVNDSKHHSTNVSQYFVEYPTEGGHVART